MFVVLIFLVGGSVVFFVCQLIDLGYVVYLVSVGEDIQVVVILCDVCFFIDNGVLSYNFEGEQFNEQVWCFFYDDEWMKQVGQDYEICLVDLIFCDDDIVIMLVVDGMCVMLIYYSGLVQFLIEFFESRFIIEYVLVEFEMIEQGWMFINLIFFVESGGLY